MPSTIGFMGKKGTKRKVQYLDRDFPLRLNQELARTQLGKAELATKAKVTRQAVYRLTDEKTPPKNIEPLTLFAICGPMSTNPQWLVTGEGPRLLLRVGDKALPIGQMEAQLLYFFQHMDPGSRDELIGTANRLFIKAHPEKSASNPYADADANLRHVERLAALAPKLK